MPLNIAVYLGGISAEREVSLRTGEAVASALLRLGYNVTKVDVRDTTPPVPPGVDCVFLALHGTFGEDGAVQQYLQSKGVPYTGSGVEGSRVSFDKILSKRAFEREGVPTPAWQTLSSLDEFRMRGEIVIKPPAQGSSVGVKILDNFKDALCEIAESLKTEKVLLVEQRVRGKELTVGILGDQALPVIEIRPRSGVYDYQSKYTKGATEYLCPAPLSEQLRQKVQSVALAAHRAAGAEVYSRVDVIIDEQGQPWVLELNTIPGMTETSLLPKAAAAAGISFDELCHRILELSLKIRGRRV